MGTKRISDEMERMLNTQMTREAFQAQVYLSYASWAEINSFVGISTFLYGHMNEEREHMFKFLKYINARGGSARIEAIAAAPANPANIGECLNAILQHEIQNSKEIDKIVTLAHDEKDWATFNFGQYFVKEQIEEESLINELLDKYNLAAEKLNNNTSLYEFDRDITNFSQEGVLPREEKI